MGKKIDITGQRFGRLVAIKQDGFYKGRAYWLFRCDCGNEKVIPSKDVRNGKVSSCGCLRKELLSKRETTHGLSKTRIYRIWKGIKRRCSKDTVKHWEDYGGRGISMCDEWKEDFMSFYKWSMNNGYKECLSIDRIDVNGNYEPSNCRWATQKQQSRNKRGTIRVLYRDELMPLMDACEKIGISEDVVLSRMKRGASGEEALLKPVKKTSHMKPYQIRFNGKTNTISGWAREVGVDRKTISYRLSHGWTIEETLTIKAGEKR